VPIRIDVYAEIDLHALRRGFDRAPLRAIAPSCRIRGVPRRRAQRVPGIRSASRTQQSNEPTAREFGGQRVVATLLLDTGGEVSAVILARDLEERFRCHGHDGFLSSPDEALHALEQRGGRIASRARSRAGTLPVTVSSSRITTPGSGAASLGLTGQENFVRLFLERETQPPLEFAIDPQGGARVLVRDLGPVWPDAMVSGDEIPEEGAGRNLAGRTYRIVT
jgi:hypothetical protein